MNAHKIYEEYNHFAMLSKRKEDTSALIHQQWELVLAGKSANKLTQLLYEYELDLLTLPLDKNVALIQKYVWGLIIAGEYLQLSLFLARTKQVASKAKVVKIAEAGKTKKLGQLGKAVENYLVDVKDEQLKQRIKEATLHAILKILSQYFINYKFSDLKGLFNASEDDVRQLGYSVRDGYVETKMEESHSDCLSTKLRELAIVANKMNKFE